MKKNRTQKTSTATITIQSFEIVFCLLIPCRTSNVRIVQVHWVKPGNKITESCFFSGSSKTNAEESIKIPLVAFFNSRCPPPYVTPFFENQGYRELPQFLTFGVPNQVLRHKEFIQIISPFLSTTNPRWPP